MYTNAVVERNMDDPNFIVSKKSKRDRYKPSRKSATENLY